MIKKLLICVAIFAFCGNCFAKTNSIKPNLDPKLAVDGEIGKKIGDSDVNIQPFDFNKLMSEAERYFKAAKEWKKIKCEPKSGFLCSKWECNKRSNTSYLILDKKKDLVTRCENGNCESFAAEFEQTGVFTNIQAKGPIGTLIRILGDSRYKEITTVGLDAYIANGNCTVITDEK